MNPSSTAERPLVSKSASLSHLPHAVRKWSLRFGSNRLAIGAGLLLALALTPSQSSAQYYNTATGTNALFNNTTGDNNTADGYYALYSNTTGSSNTADGAAALYSNTTGYSNTADGYYALFSNTTGYSNTAAGYDALNDNTSGNSNTADGFNALASNSTGNNNVAVGYEAGLNLTTGSNNIDIGAAGVAGESGRIRIGTPGKQTDTLIAGIYGKTIASGVQVIIGSGGKLGTIQSSSRYKEAIKPMEKASEALLALEPVTYRYKHDLDPDAIPQFGLIAEQVEKVNPDLVARDEEGKVTTVRYEAVNAMLLNEFLKEHRKVEEQAGMMAQMKKQIEALTATVQKVSDRIELSRPAPQVVGNNR